MKREIERWYKKLWETKGTRFIGSRRLELHDLWSTITVALCSVYIVCLNLLVLYPETKRLVTLSGEDITYLTICLSVLVLSVSLIVTSRNYKLRSEKFHECGRRIDNVYYKICIWKNTQILPNKYELKSISDEYLNILDKYENHTHLDYMLFMANNLTEYNLKCKYWFWFRIKSQFYLQTVGIYVLIILTPLFLLIL